MTVLSPLFLLFMSLSFGFSVIYEVLCKNNFEYGKRSNRGLEICKKIHDRREKILRRRKPSMESASEFICSPEGMNVHPLPFPFSRLVLERDERLLKFRKRKPSEKWLSNRFNRFYRGRANRIHNPTRSSGLLRPSNQLPCLFVISTPLFLRSCCKNCYIPPCLSKFVHKKS
jgi:hypothetical protein